MRYSHKQIDEGRIKISKFDYLHSSHDVNNCSTIWILWVSGILHNVLLIGSSRENSLDPFQYMSTRRESGGKPFLFGKTNTVEVYFSTETNGGYNESMCW